MGKNITSNREKESIKVESKAGRILDLTGNSLREIKDKKVSLEGTELFSKFTADIIKAEVQFTR